MKRRPFFKLVSGLVGLAALSTVAVSSAQAADYPERPINVVVPYKAGGGTDAYARALAAASKEALNVPLVIINKPGAGGLTGARSASQARADGYTIMLTSGGSLLLNSMQRDLPVGPFKSFRIIAQVGELKSALMLPSSSPYKNVEQLIAAAKAKPGSLRWAHSGRGGFHHIAGLGFLKKNGLEAQDVPFKGGGPARAAVMGAQIDFAFLGVQQTRGFEDSIRVLGLSSNERDSVMSEVKTLKEQSIPFSNISSPVMVFAPKDTSDEVVQTLVTAIEKITASDKFADLLLKRGNAPVFVPTTEAEAKLRAMEKESAPIIAEAKE